MIPVPGFYEWPRPKKRGQAPYFVHGADQPILAFGVPVGRVGGPGDGRGDAYLHDPDDRGERVAAVCPSRSLPAPSAQNNPLVAQQW